MSISEYNRVHFIGIGGIGMSALARLFLHEGKEVSGSDLNSSQITEALIAEGAAVTHQQVAANLEPGIDLVVYTEAMKADHPELVAARQAGVKTINYFEALGLVANQYYLIAVSGAHGKTTTTAMLIDILEEAGFDPSAVVGSLRSKTGSNYRPGKSKYMIVEACEYRRDFLHLQPDILVITNIDLEHVDYYKDLSDIQSAFRELANKVPEEGVVIADLKNPNVTPVLEKIKAKTVNYRDHFDLSIKLRQPGLHNRMNAAAASAVGRELGIEKEVIDNALENFAGTWRRFEYKGDYNGAHIYDDYAHHPTEIKAAIAGARELYPGKKISVVFQAHTYSRTKELFNDFVDSLAKADRVLLLPIYAAREVNDQSVSAEQLAEKLTEQDVVSVHFHTKEAAAQAIKDSVGTDDVVLIMGAGDVTKVASLLTN